MRRVLTIMVLGVCSIAHAQVGEPILSEYATPLARGESVLKAGYAFEQLRSGGSSQAGPQLKAEAGVTDHLELDVAFPLLWSNAPNGDLQAGGGGKLAVSSRYLLSGGSADRYALALLATVETPTGNRRLVGDATEVNGGLLLDNTITSRLALHSNLIWGSPFGGTAPKMRFLEFRSGAVWLATARVLPVFEFAGSTNTSTGATGLIAQPEVILKWGAHVESKFAAPVGLNSHTPRIGARVQLAFIFGQPRR